MYPYSQKTNDILLWFYSSIDLGEDRQRDLGDLDEDDKQSDLGDFRQSDLGDLDEDDKQSDLGEDKQSDLEED